MTNAKPAELAFAPALHLPLNAVTQKLAFLGISGSGKTYGAGKFAEVLLDAGAQVVIIDTIGNWWALRLKANGKGEGIPIPVLGGDRGDVPLDEYQGKLVADTVATTKASLVVDVSDFTEGETRRFVADFATQLLRQKKRHKSPVMVIWEECQDIVPQAVFAASAPMVGAVQRLVKKGRNYGVGTTLISQRPQAVSKEALNQVETVFAFRTAGEHEVGAIERWVRAKKVAIGEEMIESLPGQETGHCWVWSPFWLKALKQIKVGKKRTFDASATPELGEDIEAGKLAPVDLERFKKTLSQAIEQGKANDPERLRARITELERELRGQRTVEKPVIQIQRVEVPVLKAGEVKKLEALVAKLESTGAVVQTILARVASYSPPTAPTPKFVPPPLRAKVVLRPPAPPAEPAPRGDGEPLGKAAERLVTMAATRHPAPITRHDLGVLALYSANTGYFRNALGEAAAAGYLERDERIVRATDEAVRTFGQPAPPPPGDLVDGWARKLSGPGSRMLLALVAAGATGLTRTELGVQVGLSADTGYFRNVLGELNTLGIIEKDRDVVRADRLFLGAAS